MTGNNELLDVITFCCPACQARLTVPLQLAGVEGPCPSCYHTIRAPERPAMALPPEFSAPPAAPPPVQANEVALAVEPPVPAIKPPLELGGRPVWNDTAPVLPAPVFPPPAQMGEPRSSIPEALVAPVFGGVGRGGNFNELTEEPARNFKARLAIRPPDDLDDSWKQKHREQAKGRRRVRRAEKAAQSFLDSSVFRLARVALILLSGGMATWLFIHLKENKWSLGGKNPADAQSSVTGAGAAIPSVPLKPARPPVPGDVDSEIPPASDEIPSAKNGGKPEANIASPLR